MKKVRAVIRFILFAAVFLVVILYVNTVMGFKNEDGVLPMKNYYDLPEGTVDVLFIGSSHIGVNVSTQTLWNEYGIAAYSCWGSMQPIWNSYYYLKECLKYQTPRVVVLDIYGATFTYDYAQYAAQIKNTQGMRFSRDKINAVMASAEKDKWMPLLLGLPASHARYNELTETDFEYMPWDRHTDLQETVNDTLETVTPVTLPDPDQWTDRQPLTEKCSEYLQKILDLCKKQGIPLELVTSPYELTEDEYERINAISDAAGKNGVRFTNFFECYQNYDIDPEKDFSDSGHFNKYGTLKYTRAVADDILSDYDLPDERKNPDHIWNRKTKITEEAAYALTRQFRGDGVQNYVDTGVRLYENAADSWTILARIDVPKKADDGDHVYFSCFDETKDKYNGLLVTQKEDGSLNLNYGNGGQHAVDGLSGTVDLAIVKAGTTMAVYVNGEKENEMKLDTVADYDGDFLIGCQENAEGEKFRFGDRKVYNLEIYNSILSSQQISSWSPEALPVPKGVTYLNDKEEKKNVLTSLTSRFEGDGAGNALDTGVKLYEDPMSSWTLFSKIEPDLDRGDSVYYSCFAEDQKNYRGILVRREDEGKLNIVYGDGTGITADMPTDRPSALVIRKNRLAYDIWLNGKKLVDGEAHETDAYGGDLMIGCELDENGTPYRYSGTTVDNFEVIDGLLPDEKILAWDPETLPEAKEKPGSDVTYTLDEPFAGNGEDASVDTGVQLYDVPKKDWSLNCMVDPGGSGTLFSCFAEDPADYRGLAVRQSDDTTLTLITGQASTEITIPDGIRYALGIVKRDDVYTIYIDGEKQAEVQSLCSAYDGTLLIGCERTVTGRYFRYSTQRLRQLKVSSGAEGGKKVRQFWKDGQSDQTYRK